MTQSTLNVVMDRVRSASPESKIAVFRTKQPFLYEAMFDACLRTKMMIITHKDEYIGSFDQTDNRERVKRALEVAIRGPRGVQFSAKPFGGLSA